MENLIEQLVEFGEIKNIKNDYVFTLLMIGTGDVIGKNVFKIMEIVNKNITDKRIIEVMSNDSNYILIVLKP